LSRAKVMALSLVDLFRQPGVVVKTASLCEEHEALFPEEAALVATAVEKRRTEFRAGRSCARKALVELGITAFPLLAGTDRAPIWPPSVVGSITHTDGGTDGYCAVAVANQRTALGLGLDAEPLLPLPAEVWPLVLDGEEARAARHAADPGVYARILFSAKEATYKAIFPAFKRFLEFSDVHVDLLPQQGIFFSELIGSARDLGFGEKRLMGRMVIDHELLVTGMILFPAGFALAQKGMSIHHVPF
jgi:4'-phosphopantetheinyl transferase EntD